MRLFVWANKAHEFVHYYMATHTFNLGLRPEKLMLMFDFFFFTVLVQLFVSIIIK